MSFESSVPTTMTNMFKVRPKKVYRELGKVVDTLDSVGTKAASPCHLIYENPAKADYGHVGSRVSHIWKGKKKEGSKGGTWSGRNSGRRPSEYLLEGLATKDGDGVTASRATKSGRKKNQYRTPA